MSTLDHAAMTGNAVMQIDLGKNELTLNCVLDGQEADIEITTTKGYD